MTTGDSLFQLAREARQQSGKGLLTQATELLSLRFGAGRLGLSEYYFYRVYEHARTPEQRQRFAGWRLCRDLDRSLNSSNWRAIANDKLLMYGIFEGLQLPYPKLKAVYSAPPRRFPHALALHAAAQVEAFLRDPAAPPYFMKPLHGSYGRGACSVVGYEAGQDSLLLGNGERWKVAEAVAGVIERRHHGYLFQDLVVPHPDLREVCGRSVSSARVVVLLEESGPRLFRAVWKVPTGGNMSDNFMHGETGNLLALVDVQSGRVDRVITGVGTTMREVAVHPERGAALKGRTLPDWPAVRELCLSAASAFPGLKLQHWDVALGEQGPVILEINVEGSMDLHQLAGSRGVWDPELSQAFDRARVKR